MNGFSVGYPSKNEEKWTLLIFAIASLVSFAVPLWLCDRLQIARDWDYCNALSLVVRSSVLFYHTFPLHDPWILGGTDILANPLSRVFSPNFFLDVALPPHKANLLSLVLYGFAGLWGMYFLLRHFNVAWPAAIVGSILYIDGGVFGLHFADGHIPFGSFQILPWIFYAALRKNERRFQLLLVGLMSLLILDGSFNVFVYAGFVILFSLLWDDTERPRISIQTAAALAASFLLIVSVKLVPVFLNLGVRRPHLIRFSMPLSVLMRSFFQPFQHLEPYGYFSYPIDIQEFGCYLGVLSVGIVIVKLTSQKFFHENRRLVALAALWLWVGSGWGGKFNPWFLFERLPVLNNVRIPSRGFMVMFFFFCVLLARALDSIKSKRVFVALAVLLVAESVVSKNYPLYQAYKRFGVFIDTDKLITNQTIRETVPYGQKPLLYYEEKDHLDTYEPAIAPTQAACSTCPGYKGEIYFIDGTGSAAYITFTPGLINAEFNRTTPGILQLNTNALFGWRVVKGPVELIKDKSGLVTLKTLQPAGTFVLKYAPGYFWPSVALSLLGWLLLFFIGVRSAPRASQ